MKLKLGIEEYRVIPVALAERATMDGEIRFQERVIAINPDRGAAVQAATLLHELLHWAFEFGRFDFGKAVVEERVVLCAEAGLALVFKDNPELLVKLGMALHNGVPIVGPGSSGALPILGLDHSVLAAVAGGPLPAFH